MVVIGLCSVATASAQTPSPFAYWQNSTGIALLPLAGPPPEWRIQIGPGVVALPIYEGADSTRLLPSPEFDIRYRDIAFASAGDGLGVNLLRGQNYRAGIALGYDVGREHNLATRLSGTGNVDPTPEAKVVAEYALLPLVVSTDIRQGMIGHQGLIGDLGVYMPIAGNETFDIFLGPAITVADTEYMQSYFGISTAQVMGSRAHFPPYQARGGLKDATLGVTAIYHFTDQLFTDASATWERLADSAGNSPIVQTRDEFGVSVTVGYQF